MSSNRIMLVEDEAVVRDVLTRLLKPVGYELLVFERGDEAMAALKKNPGSHDLLITDLNLPGATGIDLLEASRNESPDVPVIVITAYASVDTAVEAMRAGAFDYIPKPFNNDQVMLVVKKALEKRHLVREVRTLKQQLDLRYGFENIIGNAPTMREVFELIRQAAPSSATILIRGESGTGKELIARAIHQNSPRKGKPFIPMNAGSIPNDLLESQMFGHVKGAFTSADSDKKGLFEMADKGSLFMDEIGNINLEIQAKLLRVLQEKEFMPVGSTKTVKVDVRLICATNADLEKMVEAGEFREDLYYRLNVIEVHLPALRDRMEDLPLLIDHFIRKYEKDNAKKIDKIDPGFLSALENYRWPGNVRELENLIERAVVLSPDGIVDASLLPSQFRQRNGSHSGQLPDMSQPINLHEQLQIYEKNLIVRALEKSNGVQKKAAEMLGLKTTTFSEMLKRHGLR